MLSACGSSNERTYEYPSGYRVALYLMGGKFSDGTSDRVHGGIMQPTALKDVPRLVHGDPYLSYDKPFAVWNTDPYGYGTDYTDETIIDRHLTLYAVYGKYIYDEYSLMEVECGNPSAIYVVSENISTSSPWTPLCPDKALPFKGKIYGKGHGISYTTVSTGNRVPVNSGLFAYAAGASFGDLVISAGATGTDTAGGLVAVADDTRISKVKVYGRVTGNKNAGGIAGKITGGSQIIHSSSGVVRNTVTVTANDSSAFAGGVVGHAVDSSVENSSSHSTVNVFSNNSSAGGIAGNGESALIKNNYHIGSVKAAEGIRMSAGGIAGRISDSEISMCFSDTVVQSPEKTEDNSAGGIVGLADDSDIHNSSAVGLLVVGSNAGRISGNTSGGSLVNNYARSDTALNYKIAESSDNNGTSIKYDEMRKSESFYKNRLGMDFRLMWQYPDNYVYPVLKWEDYYTFKEIYTADELDAMRDDTSGWYILMKDIDLIDWGTWRAVGNSLDMFNGVFDGNGKTISNMTGADLFGPSSTISIYNLKMLNVNSTMTGLVRSAVNANLYNVHVTGKVTNAVSGGISGGINRGFVSDVSFNGSVSVDVLSEYSSISGGLFGNMRGGIIMNSYSTGVVGNTNSAGGLIGEADNVTVINSYSLTDVYSKAKNNSYAGGAFGTLTGSVVAGVYSYGDVMSTSSGSISTVSSRIVSAAGGFAGKAANSDIRNSASFGGSAVADYYDITSSYGAESRVSSFVAVNDGSTYRSVFSNRYAFLDADYTNSGVRGDLIENDFLTEDFYYVDLGFDFDRTWRMPVVGDIRTFPVFKQDRDLIYPVFGDEWYWFGIRKYYEEF